MSELAPARAGLRQELGNRRLQQILRKQERRFEWNARRCACRVLAANGGKLRILIEEPRGLALEDVRDYAEHLLRRIATAALDHAEIRHRWRRPRIELRAARRQVLERDSIRFAQRAQFRPEKVIVPHRALHRSLQSKTPCESLHLA